MKKIKFSKEEDELLKQLAQKYLEVNKPINFKVIAFQMNRKPRQVKERYNGYLRPDLKTNEPWTAEEDKQIEELVQKNGRKWIEMEKLLPGRSNVMIKNRYNFHIINYRKEKKKEEEKGKITVTPSIEDNDFYNYFNNDDNNDFRTNYDPCSELY